MSLAHKVFLGSFVVQVIYVLIFSIYPAQDLPQHLAMGKIFLDYGNAGNEFSNYYQLPENFSSYHLIYYLLAFFGKWLGILGAFKLLLVVYLALLFGSYFLFYRQIRPTNEGDDWPLLLINLWVWNGSWSMGFISYTFALPFILLGIVAYRELVEKQRYHLRFLGLLATSVVALSLLHIAAAGVFCLFLVLVTFFHWSKKKTLALSFVGLFFFASFYSIYQVGGGNNEQLAGLDWGGAIAGAFGLEFISIAMDLKFYDPFVIINYFLWNLLGPYPISTLTVMGVLLAGAYSYCRQLKVLQIGLRREMLYRPALAFFALTILAPWGMYRPTELTFINFRMFTLAILLFAPLITWELKGPGRMVFVMLIVGHFLHHSFRTLQLQQQSQTALSLMEQARPTGMMGSLVYHNKSPGFAKMFRLTHFLPMYYTVFYAGVNSQFWARYTTHLPIGYRLPFLQPNFAHDWNPHQFNREHLKDVKYVLWQNAAQTDRELEKNQAQKAKNILDSNFKLVACQDLWCLYQRPIQGG